MTTREILSTSLKAMAIAGMAACLLSIVGAIPELDWRVDGNIYGALLFFLGVFLLGAAAGIWSATAPE